MLDTTMHSAKPVRRAVAAIVIAAITVIAALALQTTWAEAATSDAEYPDHVINTTSPSGTQINLFDYWITTQSDYSTLNGDSRGINSGHQLKFNTGGGTGINRWPGTNSMPLSFVSKTLVDGYPQIAAGTYGAWGYRATYTAESLDYLFTPEDGTGKKAYTNVKGLLKYENGYYVYDDKSNFAVYSANNSAFDVYDKPAVHADTATGALGQFFPFNKASDVFRNNGASANTIASGSTSLNHHFGMSMRTKFVQPVGGKVVTEGVANNMTFEFSGDDDVWVYIDGVLVGDLGGIHGSVSLRIDFATGQVKTYNTSLGPNSSSAATTTLKACFDAAGATSDFSGNTFADNSQHELEFFFLERGANSSNMKIKYNMHSQPTSEVSKVDQDNSSVAGARFKLYYANKVSDSDYEYTDDDLVASGTTDAQGKLMLTKADGSIISFDDEYDAGHANYVLLESGLPAGYRTSLSYTGNEAHLDYVKSARSGGDTAGGVLVSPDQTVTLSDGSALLVSRQWLNSGFLSAKETITLESTCSYWDGSGTFESNTGTTFAAVVKNTKVGDPDSVISAEDWLPVSGTAGEGYTLMTQGGDAGVIAAVKANGYGVFAPGTSGQMQTEIAELPGDITKYAYMMSDEDVAAGKAEYSVVVCHSTADSLDKATADNTKMVSYKNISVAYASRINLTNIKNRIWIQKVDDAGNPVGGAKFGIYTSDSVTDNGDGTYTVKQGAQPYDTITTKEEGDAVYSLPGGAMFPEDSDGRKPLLTGIYYVAELSAPDGYKVNPTVSKVVVASNGVYADGIADENGVQAIVGPGILMSTLRQFGDGVLNKTLSKIKGTLQTGTATTDEQGATTIVWNDVSEDADWVAAQYSPTQTSSGKTILTYKTADGELPILHSDSGIARMLLRQDATEEELGRNGDYLSTLDLNPLFTAPSGVQYTDQRVARLEVSKAVSADEGLTPPVQDADGNDIKFTFKFTLPTNNFLANTQSYDAQVFDAKGNAVGDTFKLKNGDTHAIGAGETIRVYGLAKGDAYTVQELTSGSSYPAGYSLKSRTQGGVEQQGEGDSISGTVAEAAGENTPDANKLVFTNNYSASPATLDANSGLYAKKTLTGRDFLDTDSFSMRLRATAGAPMPADAATDDAGAYKDATVSNGNKAFFGDIVYAKPGTYDYSISEVVPAGADAVDGITYSAAAYTARVVVVDDGQGALQIQSVTMTMVKDDTGASAKSDVPDLVATFGNSYDEYRSIETFRAQKVVASNGETYPVEEGDYTFTVEPVGGYNSATATVAPNTWTDVTAADVPMPQDATGSFIAANAADGTVVFAGIPLTAKANAGRTYVYKMTEMLPEDAAKAPGMIYDSSTYYAAIRAAWNNQGVTTSVEYYKLGTSAAGDDTLVRIASGTTPVFTNVYTPVAVASGPVFGQKIITGRNWTEDDSFVFRMAAADAGTRAAIANGDITGWNDSTSSASVYAPEEGARAGEPLSFEFATDADDNKLTFNKPGTYTFNITETREADVRAGLSYDTHTSTVTFVIRDNQATGKLEVASHGYDNSTAAQDSDRRITSRAAFTNAYNASGTFAGVDVSKVMKGKNLEGNDYTFTVAGLTYNGQATVVPADEATVKNPAADEGARAHLTVDGRMLFSNSFTQADLGKTFVYRVSEVHGEDGGGYTYDTVNAGDAFVVVVPYADNSQSNADGSSKIFCTVTVLKGASVTTAYEESVAECGDATVFVDDKLPVLLGDATVYAKQWATGTSAQTPYVDFTNKYEASLDYNVEGGFNLIKTVTNGSDKTIGSPSSTFNIKVVPIATENAENPELSTTAQEVADLLGITVAGKIEATDVINGYYDGTSTASGYWSRNITSTLNKLRFDQTDDGKTYRFTLQEVDTGVAGFGYDTTVYTVSITLEDNGDGTMTGTVAVSKPAFAGGDEILGTWSCTTGQGFDGDEIPYAKVGNTYTADAPSQSKVTPKITKVVAGKDADETFGFDLVAADEVTRQAIADGHIVGNGMSADNNYTEAKSTTGTIADGAKQAVEFSEMSFYKVGTYTFAVSEQPAQIDGFSESEWRYDSHTYTITVTITDKTGELTADVAGSTVGGGSLFTNSYSTSTTYGSNGGLDIVKTLVGRGQRARDFTFVVQPSNEHAKAKVAEDFEVSNAPAAIDDTATSVSKVAVLDDISFGTADKGNDFVFKIYEKDDGKQGYTYDDGYWMVTITPRSDDAGATLHTETTVVKHDAEGSEVDGTRKTFVGTVADPVEAEVGFDNGYEATGDFGGDADVKVQATKLLTGDGAVEGEYAYNIYLRGTDPATGQAQTMHLVNTSTITAVPNQKVNIYFDKITFTLNGPTTQSQANLNTLVRDGYATRTQNVDGTDTYNLVFTISEDMSDFPAGVRPARLEPERTANLIIVDDGKGTLTPAIVYPSGVTSLTFENIQDKVKTIGTVDDPTVDIDGQMLSIGDEYVYSINWTNNAIGEDGKQTAADVTVTDVLPAGVELVEDGTTAGYYYGENGELVWELGSQAAGAHGTVNVRVRITEDARLNIAQEGDVTATVANNATIRVGDHDPYTGITVNYVPVKENEGEGFVGLGDEITYKVSYRNTSDSAADIYIFDSVPQGTEFVSFGSDAASQTGVKSADKLSWKLQNVAAGAQGTVSFTVKIAEDAFTYDAIYNTATMKVGENGPEVKTNTVDNRLDKESLLFVNKIVESEVDAPEATFTFRFEVMDADGNALTRTYSYRDDDYVYHDIKSGDTFTLTDRTGVTFTTLPTGALWKITELDANGNPMEAGKNCNGFTVDENPKTGIVSSSDAASFTNTYAVESLTVEGSAAFPVAKALAGRDWSDADSFTVRLSAQDGAPIPAGATGSYADLVLTKDVQSSSFGDVVFSKPGTYRYTVRELSAAEAAGGGDIPATADGMRYSLASYEVTVVVTDNGDGTMSATCSMEMKADDSGVSVSEAAQTAAFSNVYAKQKTVFRTDAPEIDIDGRLVGVGDEYSYDIGWENNTGSAQSVEIEDSLPAGTEFVSATDGGVYDADTGKVVWSLGEKAALDRGTVCVTVRVTEDAVERGKVENEATIRVGEHVAKTNLTSNPVPKKTVSGATGSSGAARVGDVLTYTVSGACPEGASVTVTDKVPAGTEYVDGSATQGGTYDAATGILTWSLQSVAGGSFSVSFDVRVTAAALTEGGGKVPNSAGVTLDDDPSVRTNEVVTPVNSGALTVSKKVTAREGLSVDDDMEFSFTVDLFDVADNPISGTFGGVTFNAGKAAFTLSNGDSINIDGLPDGASYTVTEELAAGYETSVSKSTEPIANADPSGNAMPFKAVSMSGSVTTGNRDTVSYSNRFDPTNPSVSIPVMTKQLQGRNLGLQEGEFTFAMTVVDAQDAQVGEEQRVANAADGSVKFGDVSFSAPGTYKIEIREVVPDSPDPQIEYSANTYSFPVTVTQTKTGLEALAGAPTGDSVFVNTFSPKQSTKTVSKQIDGEVVDVNGWMVGVGDELTYTVNWANDAIDAQTGASCAAVVTVTDKVPEGTEYVAGSATAGGVYDAETGIITWSLGQQEAGAEGAVSFKVNVTNDASNLDVVDNYAKVTVGGNDAYTNTVVVNVPKKEVSRGESGDVSGAQVGDVLTYSVTVNNQIVEDENTYCVTDVLSKGLTFISADSDGTYDEATRTVSWPEFVLAPGKSKTVSFTASVNAYALEIDGVDNSAKVRVNDDPSIDSNSTHVDVETGALAVSKTLSGGDPDRAFVFTVSLTDKAGSPVSGTFSDVAFGADGMATISLKGGEQKEISGLPAGAAYTVAEAAASGYTPYVGGQQASSVTGTVPADSTAQAAFTNVYSSSLDYSAAGGLWLSKTLTGRAMETGQFEWTLVPANQASADLLGIDLLGTVYQSGAKAAGEADLIDLLGGRAVSFTQSDDGKEFSYTLTETKVGGSGYTNDTAVRTLGISVTDNGDGTISATTTVSKDGAEETYTYTTGQEPGDRATAAFANSYAATGGLGGDGEARLEAEKRLLGRSLRAGEFSFEVQEADGGVVATGTNAADGSISFSRIAYTQDDCGMHSYKVVESTDSLPDGVAARVSEFAVAVTVTDNGDGTLSATVGYPEGYADGLVFENVYGESAEVDVPMNGSKAYEVDDALKATAPDIEGRFTFTLTGSAGAPMPEGSAGLAKTVSNSQGSVTFGTIEYTMEGVFGQTEAEEDGKRERTFTYTVAESGSVPGVTIDTAARTVTVTITDNGDGTLSVAVASDGRAVEPGALKFGFTNTYKVDPVDYAVSDGIQISKNLEGRDLVAGEFAFELVDAQSTVVATGDNDAFGKVSMSAVHYTVPGTYDYRLLETKGSLGGVTYDDTSHGVRVVVKDNSQGKLVVDSCTLLDLGNAASDSSGVTFDNTYKPASTTASFGAAKIFKGATLTNGQFAFELKNAEGQVISTASNDAKGNITFDAIAFEQAGTYTYAVCERNDGQTGVAYDTAEHKVVVTVTDLDAEGKATGQLKASVAYDQGVPPVFTNTYAKPDEPVAPSGDSQGKGKGKGALPKMGDANATTGTFAAVFAYVGVAAMAGGLLLARRNRRV